MSEINYRELYLFYKEKVEMLEEKIEKIEATTDSCIYYQSKEYSFFDRLEKLERQIADPDKKESNRNEMKNMRSDATSFYASLRSVSDRLYQLFKSKY